MSPRAHGQSVRKVCRCAWRQWPKCPHSWYFSFKPRGGQRHRFSLDAEFKRHIDSKSEAETLAREIRDAITAGTFRHATPVPAADPVDGGVSLDAFAAVYLERGIQARGKTSWKDDASLLNILRNHRARDGRRLGAWLLSAITEDELESFHAAQRTAGRAASTLNHYVQTIQAAFRWAARKGYLARSPLSDDSALKRTKVAQRRRRLTPIEETPLLAAAGELTRGAGLRLQWLIVAAIETGARLGELLSLTWADVDLDRGTLLIRAVDTGAKKTGRSRKLPVSARLGAILEMATTDPAGRRYAPHQHVFGALGARIRSVDKAWDTAVLRAHGHEPTWTPTKALTPESRAVLHTIDLHFHDLRHEAGCRWLEAGWPLHHVREMLGHANLSQTSTYLHASEEGLAESMRRFDAARGKSVAKEAPREDRPVGHDNSEESTKGLLH